MTDELKKWEQREAERKAAEQQAILERRAHELQMQREYLDKSHAQLLERDAVLAKANDERMERAVREQTAATILAALIQTGLDRWNDVPDRVRRSVVLADALRAELAVKP